MKYMKTILAMSVHFPNDNAHYGETATHITINDEAGGGFIVLTQHTDSDGENKLRFDLDELVEITKLSRKMIKQFDKNSGNKDALSDLR